MTRKTSNLYKALPKIPVLREQYLWSDTDRPTQSDAEAVLGYGYGHPVGLIIS